MRLTQSISKRLTQKIDNMLDALPHAELPATDVQTASLDVAKRDVPDPEALAALAVELGEFSAPTLDRALWDLQARKDYLQDRQYRLLNALRTDGSVALPDPSRRAVLAWEAELGRLPLSQAFERVAELEVGLDGLAERARRRVRVSDRELRLLVGPRARSDDARVLSVIASEIVMLHLADLKTGGPGSRASLFERRMSYSTVSGAP